VMEEKSLSSGRTLSEVLRSGSGGLNTAPFAAIGADRRQAGPGSSRGCLLGRFVNAAFVSVLCVRDQLPSTTAAWASFAGRYLMPLPEQPRFGGRVTTATAPGQPNQCSIPGRR
jgi:hypothetical protein